MIWNFFSPKEFTPSTALGSKKAVFEALDPSVGRRSVDWHVLLILTGIAWNTVEF